MHQASQRVRQPLVATRAEVTPVEHQHAAVEEGLRSHAIGPLTGRHVPQGRHPVARTSSR